MGVSGIISAIIVGLIIGGLARLVLPGRQPIGILMTIILGLAGAFGGGYLASNAIHTSSRALIVILQIAVAAVLVWLYVGIFMRSRSRYGAGRGSYV